MNTNSKLDRFFNRSFIFTEGVRDQFPAIWELADMALIKSSEAMGYLLEDPASLIRTNAEFYEGAPLGDRLGVWGSVTRYQINSLLTVFSRDLDEGLAILRMATESARTLKTITSSPQLHRIWANGEDKSSKEYRKAAKFDQNDSIEASVFAAYNFCSNHGTHGHKTSAVYLEDGLMRREPDISGVLMMARIWFVHFTAIQRLCLKCCAKDSTDTYFQSEGCFPIMEMKILAALQNEPCFQESS